MVQRTPRKPSNPQKSKIPNFQELGFDPKFLSNFRQNESVGFVLGSSWKVLGLISCINFMGKSRKIMGFRFRAKSPKFEKSRFNREKNARI